MVLKLTRDHAWKFPSKPPLALERGVEGDSEKSSKHCQGSAGATGSLYPALIFEQWPNTKTSAPPAVVRQARQTESGNHR